MRRSIVRASFIVCALLAQCAFAAQPQAQAKQTEFAEQEHHDGVQQIIDRALELIGIRYRRSGDSPQTGFDCSGFVRYVFYDGLGLILPHASREISKEGTPVAKDDLEPGDLVFFKTMRRAFSHVGIYLGDHLFVHAPRSGGAVRVENMQEHYWAKRYNGARRMSAGDEKGR